MNRLITALIVAALVWFGYTKYVERRDAGIAGVPHVITTTAPPPPASSGPSPYRCDGRTHCSQMTSCAEATFFLKNCPGTQMDGNNDGVPCERQWCK
jgi:hypothetical protein